MSVVFLVCALGLTLSVLVISVRYAEEVVSFAIAMLVFYGLFKLVVFLGNKI